MINQNIEFIRSYFLSFDEEEQENIFSSLSDEQKDLIVEAGVVFLSNSGVETISENSYLIEHKRELKDIQLEYFIGLADILAAGGTNEVIEKLKRSNNLLFGEVLAEFMDNTLFENDLLAGIRSVERKELKQDLSLLDKEEDELGIPDEEVKYSIAQVERKALKERLQEFENTIAENDYQYSATLSGDVEETSYSQANQFKFTFLAYAASVTIILIITGISLFKLSNDSETKSYSFSFREKTNYYLDKYGSSNRELKSKYYKAPIFNSKNQARGVIKNNDSMRIAVNNLNNHISELRTILDYSQFKIGGGNGMIKGNVKNRIDSLQVIFDTYSYMPQQNNIVLNLTSYPSDFRLIFVDSNDTYIVYVRLDDKYYLMSESDMPTKLIAIRNRYLLEKLKSIKEEN